MLYHRENNYLVINIDERIQGMSILEFFHSLFISKKSIHLLKQYKDYNLNGKYVIDSTILNKGDILKIKAYENKRDFIEEVSSLDVIYEDDILCIVNKPSGIIVHPDDKSKLGTLCNYVSYYYKQTNQDIPIRYLHRLDKETTGLVMFCKCALLQPYFDKMIEEKRIKKTYLAIIEGHLAKKELTVDKAIGENRHSKNKMCVAKSGKKAITHFKEVKSNKQFTLVSCQIETGRKHQIRVHLNYLNHPIISDDLYGKRYPEIKRLALHAYSLQFIHPLSNKQLTITCPLPQDMKIVFS